MRRAAPAGLARPISSPAPAEASTVNWLNIFYAVEWAVFAGFAFYLWYRLARDAWENELEELRRRPAEASSAIRLRSAPDPGSGGTRDSPTAGRLEPIDRACPPKLASFPAIRGALKFYQIALDHHRRRAAAAVRRDDPEVHAVHVELFLGGSGGFLWFAPVIAGATDRRSR